MEWYIQAWRRALEINGRSQRAEYWYFTLFTILILIFLIFAGSVIGSAEQASIAQNRINIFLDVILTMYQLIILIPSITVSIRRLHDIGLSGWWLLIGFIPLIGTIVLIVFHVKDSEPGTNKYGPNPKSPGTSTILNT